MLWAHFTVGSQVRVGRALHPLCSVHAGDAAPGGRLRWRGDWHAQGTLSAPATSQSSDGCTHVHLAAAVASDAATAPRAATRAAAATAAPPREPLATRLAASMSKLVRRPPIDLAVQVRLGL